MSIEGKRPKIKVEKNGPYIVSGDVPLTEKIITPKGNGYEYKDGCGYPRREKYALCRCGRSGNMPFCDGAHVHDAFNGDETASKESFSARARLIKGAQIDLMDDGRCAFARFCHTDKGDVWELTEGSDDEELKNEAVRASRDCPSGRLVAVDKAGGKMDTEYEPAIALLQDPEMGVSCGLFVTGDIEIESSDGQIYRTGNRSVLCRCGRSRNKPFCDAMHIPAKFTDK